MHQNINGNYFWVEELEFSKVYITFCLLVCLHCFALITYQIKSVVAGED